MKAFLPTLLLFLLSLTLTAQQSGKLSGRARADLAAKEVELAALARTMHTDTSAENRFAACKELIQELVLTLKAPNSFSYDFSEIPGVVVKTSPDNAFRIFSWELYVTSEQYRHYGAIQMNSKRLQLTPLVDRGDALRENPENVTLKPDNWLGYVAYDIVPGGEWNGQPYYFVFGYDRYARYQRQKVLDVFTYDSFGNPQFGAPVFRTYTTGTDLLLSDRRRIILNYGAEANVVLRYEPDNARIVYENLVMSPGGPGGPVNMPDGSYHALTKSEQDGMWHEAERVFTHKYEEAPRERGKTADGKNIFGAGGGR